MMLWLSVLNYKKSMGETMKKTKIFARKSLTTAVAAIAAASVGSTSIAQETSRSKTQVLMDEIIVNATKKSDGQALQEAPVAVTAFSAETLELTKVTDVQGLSYSIPNVNLDSTTGGATLANFSIRGYGVSSSIPSVEPSVGTLLDGVYLGNNFGVVTDFFDIESVEVLRGPQGLLFGRNVTGGGVLINSARPEEEFSGYVSARFETGLDQTYKAAVTGSLTDSTAGRLAVYYRDDDGWFDNDQVDPTAPSKIGKSETTIIRPSITFKPNDSSSHTLLVEYADQEGDGTVVQSNALTKHNVDQDGTITDVEWTRVMFESTWDVSFGDGTITNILGWRDLDALVGSDVDGTSTRAIHFIQTLEQQQLSNELRYNGTFGNVDVTTGVYYFEQEMDAATSFGEVGRLNDHTSLGLFASADYHVSDALTLTFGLRYTDEEKDASVAPRAARLCSLGSGGFPVFGNCTKLFDDNEEWSFVTPKVGFSWEVSDDIRFYGHYAEGYRSGGFNLRQSTGGVQDAEGNIVAGEPAFDEERHQTIELGLKSEFNDGRTRLNTAVFISRVEDLQRQLEVDCPSCISGRGQSTRNVGNARMHGLEIELRQLVGESLILDVNLGYLDTELVDLTAEAENDPDAGLVSGNDLIRSPNFTANLNVTHEYAFANGGQLVSRFNYSYRDSWFNQDPGTPLIPEADLFNLFFTYYPEGDAWSVSLYGKNLNDEVILHSHSPAINGIRGIQEGFTWGVEFKYNIQ